MNTKDILDKSLYISPFAVQLDESFTSLEDAYNSFKKGMPEEHREAFQTIVDDLPDHLKTRKMRDTSFGGNDVVNPYPSFHENDDIIHPAYQITDRSTGMGRVYQETFDKNMVVVHMTFGVPKFTNIADFYTESLNTEIANLMNKGDYSLLSRVTSLIGNALGIIMSLPILPIIWAKKLINSIAYPVTKYYDLKVAMPLYYDIVNAIVAHLSVNMNLTQYKGDPFEGFSAGTMHPTPKLKSVYSDAAPEETDVPEFEGDDTPLLLEPFGTDVLRRLTKRDLYDGLVADSQIMTTEDMLAELQQKEPNGKRGFWDLVGSGFSSQFTRSCEYVSFRLEKSDLASESASNSTGESSIASKVNGAVSSARSKVFDFAGFNLSDNIAMEAIEAGITSMKSILSGALDSAGLSSITNITKQFTGAGYLDFPDEWQSSSFNRSYSFSIPLKAVYGHPIALMESIYMPFAMLLAAAFPRATGKNSYTSPFVCRAYCRGHFSASLAMIDSISISRGRDEFGWTYNQLPLSINVSIGLKDLSPMMFVAPGTGKFTSIFGNNTAFQEYMLTLGATGLDERLAWGPKMKKRLQISKTMFTNKYFNPLWWSYKTGNTNLIQGIANFASVSRLPEASDDRRY